MALSNYELAAMFQEIADLLDIKGENRFRIRSYKTAARTIEEFSGNISDIVEKNEDLTKLPGIGKDLENKMRRAVQKGTIPQLTQLKQELPESLLELLRIETLGAKKVGKLYREMDIKTLDELRKAAENQKISNLEGFGKKTEKKIIEEIERLRENRGAELRFRLALAEDIVNPVLDYLKSIPEIEKIIAAGSFRRKKDTIGDIDILVTCNEPQKVMNRFVSFENVASVISKGNTKSSVKLRSGLQVDLRVVPGESYGAAIHYFTGSKEHNVAVRKRAVERGLKVNEYGIFRGEEKIAGETEAEIFKSVDLDYIEPELRENRGEIEAAEQGKLPDVITLEDIKGDLHTHTQYSDGLLSLEQMAEAAISKGYQYVAITDHSQKVSVANGIDERKLAKQVEQIRKINEHYQNFQLVSSIEVDILEDGSLDLSDDILKELDMVVCSIHYNRNLSKEKQTERVIRAMDNPYFTIFAHPTGRLIGSRDPYEIDIYRIMQAALERKCYLEINAHPERLDLDDVYAKTAKEMGLKLVISTDAHNRGNLENMRFGIAQARRGWLEKDDVLNTRSWEDLEKLLTR